MIIKTISDILPHIQGRDEFRVSERDGYVVIDYTYLLPDSFDDHVRLECRGLKFDTNGDILARPLHKFFNINERPETQERELNFDQPYTVVEKLDGTMIHPAIVHGELVFMTRMGCTEHAKRAERHLSDVARWWCQDLLSVGFTPIFEWTAPDNRIVVPYDASKLTLLAIRKTIAGNYMEFSDNSPFEIAKFVCSETSSATEFVKMARAVKGIEGYVVRFADGTWVKCKGDDYVLKHRAKDSILHEKNILALVLRDEIDDLLPLLDENDKQRVVAYQRDVIDGIKKTGQLIEAHVLSGEHLDQKIFATKHQKLIAKELRPLAFAVRGGHGVTKTIVSHLLKRVNGQIAVDENRYLHGANYDNR